MKKSKKFLSVLCVFCMIMAVSATAFAAELPSSDNQARVVDDDYLKHNEPFSGDYIKPVTVPADKPYVRVAIQNTATSGTLTAKVYKIVDGKEVQFDTINAKPGKWGQTGVKELPDTEICVRMSLPEGYTPEGIITIRVSAQDFLRMDLE